MNAARSRPPMPPECRALLAHLHDVGGRMAGPDGAADRMFGPVAVRIAEQHGLVSRHFGRYWGMGEEVRLTRRGRRAVGMQSPSLISRIAGKLFRH